ncbi:class I SAM-dependent methyltransferase [Streptomyces sp. HNM0663]|uniref:Class I SAM-dependent methyltransferase n=1 Tax=Streptomyces chengmaiensis TaxID=3040919 RepID=A0ABT6HJR2_9ACTN|nr:class I SAM-dependent methyltransferase [Streptomyces chengmaiensis]MDH2388532.1 class I SAM-dependent methyltransferase [Streptomyces chengmaiensis]
MSGTNPFLDPARQAELYGHASRLAGRSNALMRAKISGRPVPDTIVGLVRNHHERPDRLGLALDLGCGRGTSSLTVAQELRPRRVVGLDAAPALIEQARKRAQRLPGLPVSFLQGDFHHLPVPAGACDVVVAAFCLYHSTRPQAVVAEIDRALAPGGLAVLVTKGLDSYREMDQLVAAAGLDPRAEQHESLYISAHSGNLADLAAVSLEVLAVEHEEHSFAFDGHEHVAEYLATNPKYDLAPGLYGNAGALAATLHEFLPDRPLTTKSLVTFVVAQSGGGRS